MTDTFTYQLRAEHIPLTGRNDLSLKGVIPDSWLCVDCGFNTAPGLSTRAEVEAAMAAGKLDGDGGIKQTTDANSEVYAIRDRVWAETGMKSYGGCLCIGCLEKRIGRRLRPKDFQRNHPLNMRPGTPRLLNRRGRS